MKLWDVLYGEFEVEPVIEALLSSKAIKRLERIHMAGPAVLMNPLWDETRYEHSVGVMLLIRKLGGSLEEQIAGLIHDVSHTAFSHTVDLAMGISQENYHETIKEAIIQKSDIPEILHKFGYNSDALLMNESQFFLLEKELPALCADRIDYTLREVHRYFNADISEIHAFLNALVIYEREICINNIEAAEWFVDMYYRIVLDFFYDPLNVISNRIMADILSYAIQLQIINQAMLMTDDATLMEVFRKSSDSFIRKHLEKLSRLQGYHVVSEQDSHTMHVRTKPRIIDPHVVIKGEKIQASFVSRHVLHAKEKAISMSNSGIYLAV